MSQPISDKKSALIFRLKAKQNIYIEITYLTLTQTHIIRNSR